MNYINAKKLLTLLNLPNIGTVKARKLLLEIDGEINVYELQKLLKFIINDDISVARIEKAYQNALSIIDACQKNGIQILEGISIPLQLQNFKDTPLVLYALGDPPQTYEKNVAIIGTRKPTQAAIDAAEKISTSITQTESIVLSGLALGVDSIAHEVAVKNESRTIAVLGSGIMNLYPKENKNLAKRIVEHDGCLISAYPPYAAVESYQLVARDKIQARLSKSIILVESKINGGSMHAVKEAIKINIPIFAVNYKGMPIVSWEGNDSVIRSNKAHSLDLGSLEEDLKAINIESESQKTLFD
jgi:DNA processing protein